MKWLVMLVCINVAACSTGRSLSSDAYNPPKMSTNHEIFAIDSTIRQLEYEYQKANNAASVNEAEKLYLQGFRADLVNKRKAICKKQLNEPACN